MSCVSLASPALSIAAPRASSPLDRLRILERLIPAMPSATSSAVPNSTVRVLGD
jgi:hypothetical protein